MGVRVEVCEGKPIGKSLRWLRNEVSRYGGTLYLLNKREWRLTEPSEARRNKAWKKKVAACRAAWRKRRELGMA